MTSYDLSPEGVTEALRTLDAGSWEIAEKLRAAGVKGRPMDECRCALAVYIGLLIPEAETVHVEAEWVRVEGWQRAAHGLDGEPFSQTLRLPGGAQDFVQDFDARDYPELIEEESHA